MSYDALYRIASQGMRLEKLRVDLAAENIANQHALKTKNGKLFQPQYVAATSTPFAELVDNVMAMMPDVEIKTQSLPPQKVYQPSHPEADKKGYVTYPGVNTIEEMTTVMQASRAFEANIKIINTAHSMYLQSLSIGEDR